MSVNATISGAINYGGDYDYFVVQVPAFGALSVYTTGSADTFGFLLDAGCTDSNDHIFAQNNNLAEAQNYNFAINKNVPAGTYYIAVRLSASDSVGAYTLHVHFNQAAITSELVD